MCCIAICNYTNTYACEIITTQWHNNKKNTPLTLLKGLVCERELETEQRRQHIDLPSSSRHSCVSFSFSWTAQPEARGPSFLLSAGFLYHTLLPTSLQTPWLPVFTELYNSSIAHSISLEWHVWSSSSGNNCHAVHRSLSSGASVYDCTMGFYLVPYCQPSPPTRFLPITAIGMCHFLPVHHFGTACLAGSKVNIQQHAEIKKHPFSKECLLV